MKILFVTDELPYPPRNGSTIPIFNYMSRLSEFHDIFLLFYKDHTQIVDQQQVVANKLYANQIMIMERYKKSKITRILRELAMQSCYFHRTYNIDQLKKHIYGQGFDIVCINGFVNINAINELFDVLGSKPIYVAAINDSSTAMFRNMGKRCFMQGLPLKTRMHNAIRWLRSWPIAHIEARMLQKYDLILVQTEIERKWLNSISNGDLATKIMVLSNGVDDVLFKIPINSIGRDIIFLASLEGEYRDVLLWIIKNVWKIIKSNRSDIRFFVIGKKAPVSLCQKMKKDERIIYIEYIPNISDIFKGKAIMLAPVFKNYGLINKVVESMAAGVPVIGDSGSFNGIPEFENRRHGIIVNDSITMARSVLELLDSPERHFNIAHSARTLIKKHFSWNDRIAKLNKRFELLMQKDRYVHHS